MFDNEGKLNKFGRRFYGDGEYEIGWWQEGCMHGWGKKYQPLKDYRGRI